MCILAIFMESGRSAGHPNGFSEKPVLESIWLISKRNSWNLLPSLRGGAEHETALPRKPKKPGQDALKRKRTTQAGEEESRGISKRQLRSLDDKQSEKRQSAIKMKAVLENEKAGLGLEAMKRKFKKLHDVSLSDAARSTGFKQVPPTLG